MNPPEQEPHAETSAGGERDGEAYGESTRSPLSFATMRMSPQQVTDKNILRVLIGGFALVICLLLAAGFTGVRSLNSIRVSAARIVTQQQVSSGLVEEIQLELGTLNAVIHNLARDPESVDREKILTQLNESDENIGRIVTSGADTPEEALWRRLRETSKAFSDEARRSLTLQDSPTLASRELFERHEDVIAVATRLINASYQEALLAQRQLDNLSQELVRQSTLLFGACVLLALICAALTVRITTHLFREMEWQAGELSRVSWHMLQNQETTARRFSHELHDELGQSLTAVKANLLSLAPSEKLDNERLSDCLRLVDDSIRNVRELSQLLRPTILDDFGLDAGLRWLADGFTHRTGIGVEYQSSFSARLPEQTETHLFRIAQEALTNVARHSQATRVDIRLEAQDAHIVLSIEDNGIGMTPSLKNGQQKGLGMIGMRARARSAGGELNLRPTKGSGILIDVRIPLQEALHDQKDTHPAR